MSSKTLPYLTEPQKATEWCWAAVSKSVDTFYGGPWVQCEIVNAEFSKNTCCPDGAATGCNMPWFLQNALRRVGRFRNSVGSPSNIGTVRGEINADQPLGARIQWASGGGHFVAVYGYDDSATPELLTVGDPANGVQIVDIDEFTSKYLGRGSWSDSYFTQR